MPQVRGIVRAATSALAIVFFALAWSACAPAPSRDTSPPEDRFARVVLDSNLLEPTELAITPDGRVIYLERKGAVKLYGPASDSVALAAQLDVFSPGSDAEICSGCEDGLLGVGVDPGFADNRWIYLYYSPAGDAPIQQLSRFVLEQDRLDLSSETVVLEVAVQREVCCHTGGSIAFDRAGNLYLSTGDDVSPFESDNYTPIDERPGRYGFDAQGSSANTNDLRGKVLRIHPEPDGSYTIPEGNLFAPGTPGTRPEIYVMGGRNLYRLSVDQRTGYVYWGDVGPDAGVASATRGPRGHDEINQARGPGFFGWPYFVGNNKPYFDHDFATGVSGAAFDPAAPRNDSPNNTGLVELPPAQGAFIWYPYGVSEEFPELGGFVDEEGIGEGGRTAMAGPVFHADDHTGSSTSLPEYYDGKLFIYEWMRNWIKVVTLDAQGDVERIEPFMPSTEFHRPMDMALTPDGTLYMLEYGYSWFTQNADATLVRIEYRHTP
jgi:cytochrome c